MQIEQLVLFSQSNHTVRPKFQHFNIRLQFRLADQLEKVKVQGPTRCHSDQGTLDDDDYRSRVVIILSFRRLEPVLR